MKDKPIRNVSLTEEVKNYIYKYIKTMDLKQNNKLPSEELLAELIGVSRVTVRSALNELASEGIVFRKQGKGTFVNLEAIKIDVTINPVQQFFDMITNSGYSPEVQTISVETKEIKENIVEEAIIDKLNVSKGDKLIVLKKVFYADEKPCAYCVDYFDRKILPEDQSLKEIKKYKKSIFEFLYEKINRKIVWDRVEIETKTNLCVPELTDIFKLRDSSIRPYLLLSGINFDQNDDPIMYSQEYIDTDFIKFNMIRQRKIDY